MTTRSASSTDALIGRNIRLHREERKMSQVELGAAIGVTFQQVQKYENATNRVPASRLLAISCALNVPVGKFFIEQ
jgi:transcriptional regulator with XRE-family HTH domain